jgi:hypothetical protein
VRKRLADTTKSKDQAALIRKRESRKKLSNQAAKKNPVLEEEYSAPLLGARQAIELLLGHGVPEDIEKAFLRVAMRYREKTLRRHLPLILDADCINSFLLDAVTGQRACFCIGKKCPRRDIEK